MTHQQHQQIAESIQELLLPPEQGRGEPEALRRLRDIIGEQNIEEFVQGLSADEIENVTRLLGKVRLQAAKANFKSLFTQLITEALPLSYDRFKELPMEHPLYCAGSQAENMTEIRIRLSGGSGAQVELDNVQDRKAIAALLELSDPDQGDQNPADLYWYVASTASKTIESCIQDSEALEILKEHGLFEADFECDSVMYRNPNPVRDLSRVAEELTSSCDSPRFGYSDYVFDTFGKRAANGIPYALYEFEQGENIASAFEALRKAGNLNSENPLVTEAFITISRRIGKVGAAAQEAYQKLLAVEATEEYMPWYDAQIPRRGIISSSDVNLSNIDWKGPEIGSEVEKREAREQMVEALVFYYNAMRFNNKLHGPEPLPQYTSYHLSAHRQPEVYRKQDLLDIAFGEKMQVPSERYDDPDSLNKDCQAVCEAIENAIRACFTDRIQP